MFGFFFFPVFVIFLSFFLCVFFSFLFSFFLFFFFFILSFDLFFSPFFLCFFFFFCFFIWFIFSFFLSSFFLFSFFCLCFYSFYVFFFFLFFFGLSFFLCFFFLFSFKNKINMQGFLTLRIVRRGITRDAFTQKVAATKKTLFCRREECSLVVRSELVKMFGKIPSLAFGTSLLSFTLRGTDPRILQRRDFADVEV